jgi:hypothetical protein
MRTLLRSIHAPHRGLQSKGISMNTHRNFLPLVLAGLMAAGAVHAQSASAGGDSVDVPGAGEASTRSNGIPNMHTTNPPVMEQLGVTGMIVVPRRVRQGHQRRADGRSDYFRVDAGATGRLLPNVLAPEKNRPPGVRTLFFC